MLALDPRTHIGGYQVTGTIGAGGMGVVYLAHHQLLGRKAALKVLLPEYSNDQEVVGRFFKEARASTAIHHPGIVKVYDFGYQDDGSAFIAMELLEGESLESRLTRLGRLPPLAALRFAGQLASALAAAHGHGIVHRDLKPGNAFLVPDPQVPGGERIKLLDFGIAKFSVSDASTTQTRAGAILGSPAYMAPEQCRGLADVDARADLYAVGCMLFEMLCGRPPFDGAGHGPLAVMSAQLDDVPPLPSALAPDLSPELDALILYLLAKDPAERYQDAVALGEALAAVSGEQVSFASLPGTTAPALTMATVPSIALGPTGQPLSASQIVTMRGRMPAAAMVVSTPSRRRSRGNALALGGVMAVLIALAVAVVSRGDEVRLAPAVAAVAAVAPPAEVRRARPKPRPPKIRYTPLRDDWGKARRVAAATPSGSAAPSSAPGTAQAFAPGDGDDAGEVPRVSELDLAGPSLFSMLRGLLPSGRMRAWFDVLAAVAPAPRMITWRVISTPVAAVWDGDSRVGTTPLEVTFEATPGYATTFSLRADGHDDATIDLDGSQDADRTVALVAHAAVPIASTPPGASIVDAQGAVVGTTPAALALSRAAGPRAYTLRLDGYQELPITVAPDAPPAPFALVRIRKRVRVHIESMPITTVLRDGQPLGETPLDVDFLDEPGTLVVTLRRDGYHDEVRRVAMDRDASLVVTMRPRSRPKAKPPCTKRGGDGPGDGPQLVDVYGCGGQR